MTEKFEYKGYWFLPGKEDSNVAGILTFSPEEKIVLELIGSFEKEERAINVFLDKESVTVIHGITSDAKKVTLFNCIKYGSFNFSSSFPITKYNCQYIILGKHMLDFSENLFDSITIDCPDLQSWLFPGIIKQEVEFKNKNEVRSTTYTISTDNKVNKKCEALIDDNSKLTIRGGFSINEDELHTKFTLKQYTYFEIETISEKNNIWDLLHKSNLFIQFISLAALSPCYITKVTLYDYDNYQEYSDGKKFYHPINLYYVDRKNSINNTNKQKDYLFRYNQISNKFPLIIKAWFNSSVDIAPIRGHLIESIREKSYFSSLDFLIVVQALEGFHRRFVDQPKSSKSKKVFLKNRLTALMALFEDVDIIIKTDIDVEEVVQTRDYYSHFFNRCEKPKLKDGIDLYNLAKKLRLLLICCTLHLIGFDNPLINQLINNSYNNKLSKY